jgi:hypothetical protein
MLKDDEMTLSKINKNLGNDKHSAKIKMIAEKMSTLTDVA